jgi:hypothetical protein
MFETGGYRDIRLALPFHLIQALRLAHAVIGVPADDENAHRELERMRSEGAAFIIFAQPCFWMLDYYARFAAYLRQNFHCVLENRRLLAFDLRSGK